MNLKKAKGLENNPILRYKKGFANANPFFI